MAPPEDFSAHSNSSSGLSYIDVSDVVFYATNHERVSGIQRVTLNIVRQLSSTSAPGAVLCLFQDQRSQRLVACRPEDLLGNDLEFDASAMQYRLNQNDEGRFLPSKLALKQHLRKSGHKKLRRFYEKAKILLAAALFPNYLKKIGLRTPENIRKFNRKATLTEIDTLAPDARLILLGATWAWDIVTALAHSHKQRSGIVIQMIYDLIPHIRPEYCHPEFSTQFTTWLHQAANYTTKFICISDCSAHDLRLFLHGHGDAMPDIHVVPLAHEFPGIVRNATHLDEDHTDLVKDRFILSVGTIEPRKNCAALVRTWSALKQQLAGSTPMLVIAGKDGWLNEAFWKLLSDHTEVIDKIQVIKTPSDSQIAWLYANCLFTLFPSLYEGWGLPVGEAAWFGKYTIASSRSSVPEVMGELIDYADPDNLSELVSKTAFAITNPDYVYKKELAIRTTDLRTWDDTTKRLLAALENNERFQL